MGCRILEDRSGMSCFYDSVTDTAFGPVFPSSEVAEKFLSLECDGDARGLDDNVLQNRWSQFVCAWVCECGTLREDDEPEPKPSERFECSWCTKKRKRAESKRASRGVK